MLVAEPAMSNSKNVAKKMSDQATLWGMTVAAWDSIGFWLMVVGASLAAFAVVVSLASSWILYRTNGIELAEANGKTEILRQKNLELEKSIAPRGLEQLRSSQALKPFAGTEAVVFFVPDFETQRLAGMIRPSQAHIA